MANIQRPYGFTAPTNPLPPKSETLLLSLTSTPTYNFDTNILGYDWTSIRNPVILYHYFGTRLVDLYEELANLTPRGVENISLTSQFLISRLSHLFSLLISPML